MSLEFRRRNGFGADLLAEDVELLRRARFGPVQQDCDGVICAAAKRDGVICPG
jgi:hypothetical protein